MLNSFAGIAGYGNHVEIPWFLVTLTTLLAAAGTFVGLAVGKGINSASLRRAFVAFVFVMAAAILVHEVNVWVAGAMAKLPHTGPQLVFALLMLAIGIAAGRSSRSLSGRNGEHEYRDGGGI